VAPDRVDRASGKVVNRKFFSTGQEIFVEGDPSDHAFFVQSGAILLSARTANGIIPHSTVREKQVFGEMALLDEKRRAFTATAIVDTTCIVIMRQEFKFKLENTDPMVKALLRVLARNLSQIDYTPTWEEFKRREKLDLADAKKDPEVEVRRE
jgi:CRP/FNR family cyclic AMP-dependent transcriptional regulator